MSTLPRWIVSCSKECDHLNTKEPYFYDIFSMFGPDFDLNLSEQWFHFQILEALAKFCKWVKRLILSPVYMSLFWNWPRAKHDLARRPTFENPCSTRKLKSIRVELSFACNFLVDFFQQLQFFPHFPGSAFASFWQAAPAHNSSRFEWQNPRRLPTFEELESRCVINW